MINMFGMFQAQYKRENYLSWLRGLQGHRATDEGVDECTRCGFCCAMRPCIPTPEEVQRIAIYLEIELKQCIQKYLILDRIPERGGPFMFFAKDTQTDLTGHGIPWDRTYDKGYCVFYNKDDKLCKIWEMRPYTAKTLKCWVGDGQNDGDALNGAVESWSKVDWSDYGITENDLRMVEE